ncbi:MAG TPA: RidA family protein [Nakamurella sp.]
MPRRIEAVMPDALPAAGAAGSTYSYGVRAGDTLHIAGMVSFAPDGSILGEGSIEIQVEQAFTNMQWVVEAAGGSMDDIVQTTTYLVNTADAPVVSAARARWFTGPVKPTHTVVGVAALGRPVFLVEIEGTAYLG